MGIYAKGEQLPTTRVSDTPQDRYGDLADANDIGGGGSTLGQVIADTKATSTSANDTAGALADDLSALESRVDGLEELTSISGTGWVAHKRGGVVTLSLTDVTAVFTVPAGWRPVSTIHIPVAKGATTADTRIIIGAGGGVSVYGGYTFPISGSTTYLTP